MNVCWYVALDVRLDDEKPSRYCGLEVEFPFDTRTPVELTV